MVALLPFYLIGLPIIFSIFYSLKGRWPLLARAMVAAVSMAFLLFLDGRAFVILLAVASVNFLLFHLLHYRPQYRPWLLAFGVLQSISPLIFYKGYLAVTLQPINLLPLGLAFYALQQLTAIIDFDASREQPPHLINYLFFSFFFPYVIAGPLVSFKTINQQLIQNPHHEIDWQRFNTAITLLILGLAKLLVLAGPLQEMGSALVDVFTADQTLSLTATELLYLLLSQVFWFYFVLSGYADMAIGSALLFGLRLPSDFNSPLKSRGFKDYILRWHTSIILFAKEYLFTVLAKHLKKLPIKSRQARAIWVWALASLAIFTFTGLWHAYDLTSIIIGSICAVLLVLIEMSKIFWVGRVRIPRWLSTLILFSGRVLLLFGIAYTFIIFAHHDLSVSALIKQTQWTWSVGHSLSFLQSLGDPSWLQFGDFFPHVGLAAEQQMVLGGTLSILHLALATVIVFCLPNTMTMLGVIEPIESERYLRWRFNRLSACGLGLLFTLSMLMMTSGNVYVYGN